MLDETTLTATRDVPGWLEERVQAALVEAYGPEYSETNPLITPATKPEFGDYQCNVAMGLAKKLGQKPRDVGGILTTLIPTAGDIEFIILEADHNADGMIDRSELLPALGLWATLAERKASQSRTCNLP